MKESVDRVDNSERMVVAVFMLKVAFLQRLIVMVRVGVSFWPRRQKWVMRVFVNDVTGVTKMREAQKLPPP